MLIVCPACASEYEIAVDRIGANGRSVRCAACRETWFITPSAESPSASVDDFANDGWGQAAAQEAPDAAGFSSTDATASSPTLDQPTPSSRRSKTKPARVKSKPALSPMLAAGLALFAIVPLALLGRATVVRAMPQTAGVFSAIGLPVNLRGIAFRDVVAFQVPAQGDRPAELVVEGDLVGVARDRTDVPDLVVEVSDAQGKPLHRWTIASPRPALETDETARFRASLSGPPAQGRSAQVRFAGAEMSEAKHAAGEHAVGEAPSAAHADAATRAAEPASTHGH